MAEITLSSAVRANLLALQGTADLLSTTQGRLSTGLKVNSALDDPTAFFTASSLNDRAGDLSRLQDFTGNAVQTIKAASEGIEAITKLVESAEATARQALQSAGSTATATGTVSGLTTSTALNSITGLANADTIAVGDGTNSTVFTVAAGDTVQDLLDAINADTANTIRASLNSEGALVFEAQTATSITFVSTTGDADLDLGFTEGTAAAAGTLNTDRSSLATQFGDLLTQINQLSDDASFNGVNLLDGDSLTVDFNEDGTSSLSIGGVTFDSGGLSVSAAAGTFQTDKDVTDALADLKAAKDTLRSQAATFGTNLSVVEARQDFTKNIINVLEEGAANLTLADTNEEAANLLALQTRQALSQNSLRLASQADQSVLQLVR